MRVRRAHRVLSVSLAFVLSLITGSAARAQAGLDSLRFSGFVEASGQHATRHENRLITGRLYGQRHDQFSLNAFEIGIERPIDEHRLMAGFTVRLMYGASATRIHAAGLALGSQEDLVQAFVTLNRPTRSGSLQLSAGKFASIMGFEVVESTLNPNLSIGNQFVFLEDLSHVGIEANWNANAMWAFRACVVNGWDLAVDNNSGKTAMGRLTWSLQPGTSVALLGYAGPEQAENENDLRRGGEILATTALGAMTATVQVDAGFEDGIDASWWGAGLWWSIPVGPGVTLALRGDRIDDFDGARTSGVLGFPALDAQRLDSVTATFNYRPVPDLIVRPEVRWDRSSHAVYNGAHEQATVALGIALAF